MADRLRTRRALADPGFADEQQPAEDEPRRAARSRRPPGRRRPAALEPEPAEDELAATDEEPEPLGDEDEQGEQDGRGAAGEPAVNGGRRRRPAQGQDGSVRTVKQAVQAALRQIVELTSKPPEEITGVEPAKDGGWKICIEVIEDHRIPSSTDILATYEATIDADGELTSYRRVRRYARGSGDGW